MYSSFEIYQKNEICLIQLRAPVIKGMGIVFVEMLDKWIQEVGFSRVVVVTGLDQTRRCDVQLRR